MEYLRRSNARTLVYVSCNAATQVTARAPPLGHQWPTTHAIQPSHALSNAHVWWLQARDIALLMDPARSRPYTLESVQVCDMFPQTAHVESIAVLRREEDLPEYKPLGRKEKRKFKPQRLHKAQVPSADLPWVDGEEL